MKKYILLLVAAVQVQQVASASAVLPSNKDIIVTCSAGTTGLNGGFGRFDQKQVITLTPKPPEPKLNRNAEEMVLSSQNKFQLKKSKSVLEVVYQLHVRDLWPTFNKKTGAWKTANKTITMQIDIFVREILENNQIKVIGGSSVTRSLHFGAKDLVAPYDTALTATLLSPDIYQLAVNHPNPNQVNQEFPHEYFDVEKNDYIQSLIKSGQLNPQEEFQSLYVNCDFKY